MILDILRNQLELDMRYALFHRIGSMFYDQELTKTSTKTQTHLEVPCIVKLNQQNGRKGKGIELKAQE